MNQTLHELSSGRQFQSGKLMTASTIARAASRTLSSRRTVRRVLSRVFVKPQMQGLPKHTSTKPPSARRLVLLKHRYQGARMDFPCDVDPELIVAKEKYISSTENRSPCPAPRRHRFKTCEGFQMNRNPVLSGCHPCILRARSVRKRAYRP